jgi:hypothetical protein
LLFNSPNLKSQNQAVLSEVFRSSQNHIDGLLGHKQIHNEEKYHQEAMQIVSIKGPALFGIHENVKKNSIH